MRKHIPNMLTLLNLALGSVSVYMVMEGRVMAAVVLLGGALLFDFFDGFAARRLRVDSALGKQLDSLADLVSFGVAPAAMAVVSLEKALAAPWENAILNYSPREDLALISLVLIPVLSALRLGKFNLQAKSSSFSGLPVPANAIFWVGIYSEVARTGTFFGHQFEYWVYWIAAMVLSVLMVTPVSMMDLKFESFHFSPNRYRYLLLFVSLLLIIFAGLPGLTLAVLTYILLSILVNQLT